MSIKVPSYICVTKPIDMSTHHEKLRECFFKCKKFGISLNPNKFAVMVFLGTILNFIVFKKGY
jgi:hypothetical protein